MIYELINGTGEVKDYNYNGELIFEGHYLNGKKIIKNENNQSKE